MSCDGTWGDHVTLQAAADALGLRIHVLSDYLQEAYIEVLPELRKSTKVLQLCFWAEDWPKKCQFIKAIYVDIPVSCILSI